MYKQFYVLSPLVAILLAATAVPGGRADNPQRAGSRGDVGLIKQIFYLKKMKPGVKRIGLIWKKGIPDQEEKLEMANRAVASVGGELFVGYVRDESEVPEAFRVMNREHDVQVLWIVGNDGIVSAPVPRKYLIENAVEEGIPLLAPTTEWVSAGAPLALESSNGETRIMLNEPAANATGLQVPDKYESRTSPVVAAN